MQDGKDHGRIVKRKPTFKTEYTPLLEKYFRQNAYPSASDRATLARETNMTVRQIEVWFQNHRNRAKREGRELRRRAFDDFRFGQFLETSVSCPDNRSDYSFSDDSEVEIESTVNSTDCTRDVFDLIPRPSYAYPAQYNTLTSSVFRTIHMREVLPLPKWTRQQADINNNRKPAGNQDMDDLVRTFSMKLVLHDSTESKRRNRASSRYKPSWYDGKFTFVPRAPHPALVKPYTPLRTSKISSETRSPLPSPLFEMGQVTTHVADKRTHANSKSEPPSRSLYPDSTMRQPFVLEHPSRRRSSSSSFLSSLNPVVTPSQNFSPLPSLSMHNITSCFSRWLDPAVPYFGGIYIAAESTMPLLVQ
ncbi:hypothetical protein AMATHDRAFT_72168 [Amanita thiersii Skay4041]|uniref:Homeobox domain-containing protein n=1 Tax=Amanita thiersii Skay4041 TaxID=703135 RepID=A0A2A9N5V3_9AGAR|nr:hypothetical protein AMATHDRAFT_72168 [Amanita thiersii Skay4041]